MALSELFSAKLVLVDMNCTTAEEALTQIVGVMKEMDYVEPEYETSVIEREKQYPTGLPTYPYQVALAHSDPQYVMRSGIAVGTLQNPVPFYEMGSPGSILPVSIIFVLAVREKEKQTIVLKGLMNILNDRNAIRELKDASSSEEVIKILLRSKK